MSKINSIEKNKVIYQRFIQEIFNECRYEQLDELFYPSYTLHDAPPGTPLGTEAIKQAVSMWRTGFPDLKITIKSLIGEGDLLAARSIVRGTHHGPIFGISATGRAVSWTVLTMVRISNDRLIESWVRADIQGLMAQLGKVTVQ